MLEDDSGRLGLGGDMIHALTPIIVTGVVVAARSQGGYALLSVVHHSHRRAKAFAYVRHVLRPRSLGRQASSMDESAIPKSRRYDCP